MDIKYYVRNSIYGLIVFGIGVFILRNDTDVPVVRLLIALGFVSCLFFPFAKKAIETVALKYSTIEDWTTGAYIETPMKSGLYAMYYMVIFAVTIPIAIIYLIYLAATKKAT
ncbi:colicin E1 family microcin immunity protein [Atlantibacter sp.]|uniref:colicin E1 family microcin immunity protein n=1 Tax=Atlantibacter sp. TaxID=1903473 RepID=UPI0028A2A875|nr:colicin E1 family microcin immunity protein [Atlantibacter sp.]